MGGFRLPGGQKFVRGVDLAQKNIRKIRDTMKADQLEAALEDAAKPIEDDAQTRAPELTGRLKGDIGHQTKVKQPRRVDVAVGADDDSFYGAFQEFGTINHPPQPWLEPAFNAKRRKAVSEAQDKLRKEIVTVAATLRKKPRT